MYISDPGIRDAGITDTGACRRTTSAAQHLRQPEPRRRSASRRSRSNGTANNVAARRVDDVPGRQIAGVASALDHGFRSPDFKRVHDDARLVPVVCRGAARPLMAATVNSTAFPPGSICGPHSAPSLMLTSSSGWPPSAATRMMLLSVDRTQSLLCPSSSRREAGLTQRDRHTARHGDFLERALRRLPAQNAIDRPSGEKTGLPMRPSRLRFRESAWPQDRTSIAGTASVRHIDNLGAVRRDGDDSRTVLGELLAVGQREREACDDRRRRGRSQVTAGRDPSAANDDARRPRADRAAPQGSAAR